MKYIIMFCSTAEDRQFFDRLTDAERQVAKGRVGRWFGENGSKIIGGEELGPPHSTRTIRFDAYRNAVLTDGPFMEAKEVIGGFAIVDVADLDEALRLAKSWPGGPGGSIVEVRPLVAH